MTTTLTVHGGTSAKKPNRLPHREPLLIRRVDDDIPRTDPSCIEARRPGLQRKAWLGSERVAPSLSLKPGQQSEPPLACRA